MWEFCHLKYKRKLQSFEASFDNTKIQQMETSKRKMFPQVRGKKQDKPLIVMKELGKS